MQNIEQRLARHPFLRGIPGDNIKLIAEDAVLMVFKPGEMIMRQGRKANYLFLIEKGKVALGLLKSGEGPLTIQNLGKGDSLGWSWMFPPYKWKFDARAKTRVEILAIEGRPLSAKMGRYPLLGYEVMKKMAGSLAQRLEATRHQLVRVYRQSLKAGQREFVYFPQPML